MCALRAAELLELNATIKNERAASRNEIAQTDSNRKEKISKRR